MMPQKMKNPQFSVKLFENDKTNKVIKDSLFISDSAEYFKY